uniref:Serine protease inhibitor n=1 Tax=Amblyomma americanum TaxID=6943 RepID=A0A0E9Y2X9_AMBAM
MTRPFCTLTDFGLRLVAHALQEAQDVNVCLSPFGVAVALGMALAGTGEATTAQVVHACGAVDPNNLFRTCEKILSMLNSAMPNTKVSLGSKLFVSKEVPLLPEFKETLQETFSDDVGRLNFKENPQAAAQEVNKWAAKATDGNLTQMLREGDVTNKTRLLLVSAIYFRGIWSEPFYGPVKAPFYVNARETAQVDMLESCRGAMYCRSTRIPCEAIELSYVSRCLSLLVILPDRDVSLSKLVAVLTNDVLRRLLKDLKPVNSMAVWLPRFRLQKSYEMVPALRAVGITNLFDDRVVDMSRMTGTGVNLCVDNFIHEALFDTTEEGLGEACRPPNPLDATMIAFRANRPFLYVLLHHYNHAIVFIGAVCSLNHIYRHKKSAKTCQVSLNWTAKGIEGDDSAKTCDPLTSAESFVSVGVVLTLTRRLFGPHRVMFWEAFLQGWTRDEKLPYGCFGIKLLGVGDVFMREMLA